MMQAANLREGNNIVIATASCASVTEWMPPRQALFPA
jgi:hypothetical protein